MQHQSTTAALILAAGRSSRMGEGRHKLLLPLGDRPVLAHVLQAALDSQARPILVVLGYQSAQIRSQLTQYIQHPRMMLVENPDFQQGMSTSLRVGIQALMDLNTSSTHNYSVDSVIVLPGDQPLLTSSIIDRLIIQRQATGKRVIASLYEGKRRNPTLFAADLFAELLQVNGDEGGRSVMEQHRQEIMKVEHGDMAASYDVDTWEAYQQVVAEWERRHL